MTREEAAQIIALWLVSSKGPKGQRGYIEGWFDDDDVGAFRMAIDALHREEAEEKGYAEWIPCSERLPSEIGWYLITVQGVNRFVDMDYYYGNSEWDKVSSKQEVIAWMPLPKPYREDGEA